MAFKKKMQEGTGQIKGGGVHCREAPLVPSIALVFVCKCEIRMVLPMHMDECLSSQKNLKWKVGRSCLMPYAIVNDLSGDRKCSATQHNNQSALKLPASIHY